MFSLLRPTLTFAERHAEINMMVHHRQSKDFVTKFVTQLDGPFCPIVIELKVIACLATIASIQQHASN